MRVFRVSLFVACGALSALPPAACSTGSGGETAGDAGPSDATSGRDAGGGSDATPASDAGNDVTTEAGRPCTANPNAIGTTMRTVGGHPYVGYAPTSYDKATPTALVVGLHGASQLASDYVANIWQPNADADGFLVIAPEGTQPDSPGTTWRVSDASIILAAIDDFAACYSVDPAKIILDGSSAGGRMSYWMGLRAASRFSGISIDSADLATGEGLNGGPLLPSSWPIPVSHFHGTLDTGFPIGWAIEGMDELVDAGHPFFWHPIDGGAHGVGNNPTDALQRYEDLRSSTGPGNYDGGVWPSASDGGPCNVLQSTSAPVPEQAVASVSPTPAGGAIADGTYAIATVTSYGGSTGDAGPTGRTVQWTVVIAGQTYESLLVDSSTDAGVQSTGGGFVTWGSNMLIEPTCPAIGQTYWGFDSDGTTVTLYSSDTSSAGVTAYTFTKQ